MTSAPPRRRLLPLLPLLLLAGVWGGWAHRSCPKGCEQHGRCNAHTGVCDCLWGWAGDACQTRETPACRLYDGPDASAKCNPEPFFAKNCECYRQCEAAGFTNIDDKAPCFETPGGPEAQLSMPPENPAGATWYTGYKDGRKPSTWTEVQEGLPDKESKLADLGGCPERCSNHGLCVSAEGGAPSCRCYLGWEGRACEKPREDSCINACSQKGKCVDGVCQCTDPHDTGLDCFSCPKRQNVPKGHKSYSPLRIYVYELPSKMNMKFETDRVAGQQYHDDLYVAYRLFVSRLLHDCNVRTMDPEDANLFYVPSFNYAYSPIEAKSYITEVQQYVARTWPYWNRTEGRNHIWWLPTDYGPCTAPEPIWNSILLSHWGPMWAEERFHPWHRCFDPNKDVAVPPNLHSAKFFAQETFRTRHRSSMPRDTMFFYAGGAPGEGTPQSFSGGVREAVYQQHKTRPGWVVVDSTEDIEQVTGKKYRQHILSSKFCLAPYGDGWGVRLVSMIVNGCIPVIVQDYVYQPFEDVIPYWKFSVRLMKDELPQLPQMLESIQPEELARLQENLALYHKAFVWDRGYGTAYDYTLRNIARRLGGVYGERPNEFFAPDRKD